MSAELSKRKVSSKSFLFKTSDSRHKSQRKARERGEPKAAKKLALGATKLREGEGEKWIKTNRSIRLLAMIAR